MRRTVSAPANCGHAIAEVIAKANKVFFAQLFPSTLIRIVKFPYRLQWLNLMQRYATRMPNLLRSKCCKRLKSRTVVNTHSQHRSLTTIAAYSTTNGRIMHDLRAVRSSGDPPARPQPDRVRRTSRHRKHATRGGVLASVDARLLASTLQA
jgi:hypothetical protein